MSSHTVGIKIDDKLRERLRRLGALKDRSPHWLMKAAIQEYLEREERREQERIEDRERWERYQETGAHIGDDDMMRWLDGLAEHASRQAKKSAGTGR
jgi:predicted transcriptional regulator